MANKCMVLAFVAVSVFALSVESHLTLGEEQILVKNFAKLNEYLEKHVDSDDLEANVEIAKKKLKSSKLFLDKSLKEALAKFIQLPETVENMQKCKSHSRVLESFDRRLADETHSSSTDYPVSRIERILENVAYKNFKMCRLGNGLNGPGMVFAFKQRVYDQINDDLVDKVEGDDPETNMKALEEMLDKAPNKDGSYAQSLRQLLALKTVVTEDSCNEQGTDIIMKNDLATQHRAISEYLKDYRRITTLVNHYIRQHSTICHQNYIEKCLPRLDELDLQTYRRVLAFIGVNYLEDRDYDRFLAEVESKQVSQDFATPLLESIDGSIVTPEYKYSDQMKIARYMRALTKQDPRHIYLDLVKDEKVGKMVLRVDKITELYNDYVIEPCKKFNSLLFSDMRSFTYNFLPLDDYRGGKVSTPFNFRLLSSAYHTCNSHIGNPEDKIRNLKFHVSNRFDRFRV